MIFGFNYGVAGKTDFFLWAPFTGKINWGDDGLYSFAVQNSSGSPNNLKKLASEKKFSGLNDMGQWNLLLDSYQGKWLRKFSQAPEILDQDTKLTLKPLQLLLYKTRS